MLGITLSLVGVWLGLLGGLVLLAHGAYRYTTKMNSDLLEEIKRDREN
jgi:ABC-type methionine transport system permease subunit